MRGASDDKPDVPAADWKSALPVDASRSTPRARACFESVVKLLREPFMDLIA